jgi:hypothetical protein
MNIAWWHRLSAPTPAREQQVNGHDSIIGTHKLDRHPRSASGRGGCSIPRFSPSRFSFPCPGVGECQRRACRW